MALAFGVSGSRQILKPLADGLHDQMDIFTQNGQITNDFINQRINENKAIMTTEEVIGGHHKLLIDSNACSPKEKQAKLLLEKKPLEIENVISFITKIKNHFKIEDHIYNSLLDTLCSKTFEELSRELGAICQDNPDLLEEFEYFISLRPSSSVSEFPLESDRDVKMFKRFNQAANPTEHEHDQKTGHKRKKNKTNDIRHMMLDDGDKIKINLISDASFADKDAEFYLKEGLKTFAVSGKRKKREKELKRDSDSSFVDENTELCLKEGLKTFTIKGKRKKRVKKLKWDEADINYEKESDIERERKGKYIKCASTDVNIQKICLTSDKENDGFNKSISEFDLSKYQRCTPSYQLLPKECLRPTTYCWPNINASALNEVCASVPSTSDHPVPSSNDHSTSSKKQMTEQEEKLDQLEDDLFELDLLLSIIKSTIRRATKLQDKLNNNTIEIVPPFDLEICFKIKNLRCIERIYGAHGLDALNALSQNITCALPALLTRLKQKQEEWSRCRSNIVRSSI